MGILIVEVMIAVCDSAFMPEFRCGIVLRVNGEERASVPVLGLLNFSSSRRAIAFDFSIWYGDVVVPELL